MFMPQLPGGYLLLDNVFNRNGQTLNIVGIVVDYQAPVPSRGVDWQCCITLKDSSSWSAALSGFKVKFFKPQELLPSVETLGSIAVCRKVKVTNYQGVMTAISTRATECIIFPRTTIPTPSYDVAYQGRKQTLPHVAFPAYSKPTVEEQVYAIRLLNSWVQNTSDVKDTSEANIKTNSNSNSKLINYNNGPDSKSGALSAKFALISDIEDSRFCDLTVEVLRMYSCTDGSVELYVTDYTSNGLLFYYRTPEEDAKWRRTGKDWDSGDFSSKSRWSGPYGKMTMQIKLWPPHSTWTQCNVREENYVFLRNVRIKTNIDGRLEGILHEDKRYPSRIDIRKLQLNNSAVLKVLQCKQDYWKKFNAEISGNEMIRLTKTERNRKNRRAKKDRDRKVKAEKANSTASSSSINQHVKCANPTIPVSTLAQIESTVFRMNDLPSGNVITLPFLNLKSRIQVRVIDFWPQDLQDFSRSISDDKYHLLTVSSTNESKTEATRGLPVAPKKQFSQPLAMRNWEWAFYLLVEDVKGKEDTGKGTARRMPLLMAHDDAVHLLKLDASNLRRDTRTLTKLREKLFLLWGNLEDVKAGTETELSSIPFETCIYEYGIFADGKWQRLHSMFGTTIM